tara:strand:+ start:581 stop:1669 length:1089 start_codon:yes stop_codon:yes gene_type:complete
MCFLSRIVIPLFLIFNTTYAASPLINGTISKTVELPAVSQVQGSNHKNVERSVPRKQIVLLKVNLSDKNQTQLQQKIRLASKRTKPTFEEMVSQVELGMGNVPVFDQGMHGTCATFANVAAIDAAIGQGDYISKLCSLKLGAYLEAHAYVPSGWDGSLAPFVLNQMKTFGIVSQKAASQFGCNDSEEYPTLAPRPESGIGLSAFHQMSEDLSAHEISWSAILDVDQFINDEYESDVVFSEVKAALRQGYRVTFGTILLATDKGVAGATGRTKKKNDSWVLSTSILNEVESEGILDDMGAHEMVITGFNDHAVAVDNDGVQHQGLFKLRNSWGQEVGDEGDFYMSYDYFKSLVIEAHKIRTNA